MGSRRKMPSIVVKSAVAAAGRPFVVVVVTGMASVVIEVENIRRRHKESPGCCTADGANAVRLSPRSSIWVVFLGPY